MMRHDLALLRPLIVLAATIVLLTLVVSARRSHRVAFGIALVGLAMAFLSLVVAVSGPPHTVGSLLTFDGYARFYSGLILLATAATAILSFGYLQQREETREEYYALLLLAALGGLLLVAASHFASLFLGLELLSVSLYALIAYVRVEGRDIEAGLKYLILAAVSAAFLLFGIALVYADLGTLEFAGLTRVSFGSIPDPRRVLLLGGVGFIMVGFAFKLALVPFHFWIPDVYQGAPAPVTGFVATVSKGAMFAALLRLFGPLDLRIGHSLFLMFAALAVASMIGGNLLALLQQNLKRLLAYSSIAHFGYLLVAFLASGTQAAVAVSFYLVAYFITTIGAFGVVTILSSGGAEVETVNEYRGLAVRRPGASGVLTIMLLSLAGIPMTAGFVGKFYIALTAAGATLWTLLIVMLVTSGVGLFYYLRFIAAMYMQPGREMVAAAVVPRVSAQLLLAALVGLLVWFGLYPGPLIRMIQAALAAA
jgi:NADH-quinone oxidoreductase subunit N